MINNINSLNAYQKLMNINAENIANINTKNFTPQESHIENNLSVISSKNDKLTLSDEIINQIIIEDGFKSQIAPIKTQDEMTKTILNIKA